MFIKIVASHSDTTFLITIIKYFILDLYLDSLTKILKKWLYYDMIFFSWQL